MKSQTAKYIFLLYLYGLQGLLIGLFRSYFPVILKSQISYSEVGVLALFAYPFTLKIIWAPFIDCYFLNMFGKRKTWILLSHIIVSLLLIYLGFRIHNIIEGKLVYELAIISTVMMFFISLQDIAVDSWAIVLMEKVY